MLKKISLVLLLATIFLSFTSFSEDANAVEKKVNLDIVIFPNEPLIYMEDGMAKGFFVDLLNKIADEEGWNLTYKEENFSKALNDIESEEADILLGIAYSGERDIKYDFNEESLFINWGQIYSSSNVYIESFSDLNNKLVGVYKDDIHYNGEFGLKNILKQFDIPVKFIVIDDKEELLKQIENGALDAGVVNRTFGNSKESKYNIIRTPIQLNPIQLHMIKSKKTDPKVLEIIDSYIREWKADETSYYYQSLSRTFDMTNDPSTPKWLRLTLLAILILLFISFIIIFISRKIIWNQTKELRYLNENLEAKVEERTMDLDAANQQLRVYLLTLEEKQVEVEEMNSILENQLSLLKKAQEQLIESEKMASLGRMVSSVAHELNTPLGICVTLNSNLKADTLLQMKKFNEKKLTKGLYKEYVEDVIATSELFENNLNNMIDLVVRFKMLSSNRNYHNEQNLNLSHFLNMQMKSLSPELKKSKHSYEINCSDDIEVYLDPSVLSQVITNLTMNSIIHGFENTESGHIEINIRDEDQLLVMEYLDNGNGIENTIRDKIFEPFFTTKRNKGGTGLGLSIVHSSVTKSLGGELKLESDLGKGVKYTIKIPKNSNEDIENKEQREKN